MGTQHLLAENENTEVNPGFSVLIVTYVHSSVLCCVMFKLSREFIDFSILKGELEDIIAAL